MTKTELIETVASRNNMHTVAERRKVKLIIDDVFDIITEAVATGDNVQVIGFGTFTVATRAARNVLNPRTGEPITIPEHKLPQFKAGNSFKAVVNGDKRRIKQRAQPAQKNYYVRRDAAWTEDVGY